jgi:hypothetical protein
MDALVSGALGVYVLVSPPDGINQQVVRVDPVDGRVLARADLPGNFEGIGSHLVVTGLSVWLAAPLARSVEVLQLSASDLSVEHQLLLPVATFASIAAAGANMWVVAGGTLYRISMQDKVVGQQRLPAHRSYLSVGANPAGTELAAELTLTSGYGSYLELLDPHTGRFLGPVASTQVPGDNFAPLAFAGPLIWSSQGSMALAYIGTNVRTGHQVTAPVRGNDATLSANGDVLVVASPESPKSDCIDASTGRITASFRSVGLVAAAAGGWVYYTHPSFPSGPHYQLQRERVRGCG